jgi:hypothetical protein
VNGYYLNLHSFASKHRNHSFVNLFTAKLSLTDDGLQFLNLLPNDCHKTIETFLLGFEPR